jgi:hypothetical protein
MIWRITLDQGSREAMLVLRIWFIIHCSWRSELSALRPVHRMYWPHISVQTNMVLCSAFN